MLLCVLLIAHIYNIDFGINFRQIGHNTTVEQVIKTKGIQGRFIQYSEFYCSKNRDLSSNSYAMLILRLVFRPPTVSFFPELGPHLLASFSFLRGKRKTKKYLPCDCCLMCYSICLILVEGAHCISLPS